MRFPLQIKTGNAMNDNILCELIYGKGAHVDPVACVEDLSAELAARRVAGYPHSIGQIVLHMNYWMDYEFRRSPAKIPAIPTTPSKAGRNIQNPPIELNGRPPTRNGNPRVSTLSTIWRN